MELTDEDYGISLTSSVGTVTNTVDLSEVHCAIYLVNPTTKGSYTLHKSVEISDGRLSVKLLDDGILDGYYVCNYQFYLKNSPNGWDALPPSGTYEFSFDIASQFSYELNDCYIGTVRSIDNAALVKDTIVLNDYMTFASGDLLVDGLVVDLYRVDLFNLVFNINDYTSQKLRNLDISAAFRFVLSSGDSDISVGADTSSQDYQSGVSSSLSDLSSSVDSMTEDLSSAAKSLEYISTSQNLIIQGIDNVIMHISDQLYAFWDQLYNLIHEPTYAKLEEILAALRAIANNSDIYAVVEEIRASNNKVIANDNKLSADQAAADKANTEQIDNAIEEHGNFIIDGLKSLFIPSDDYFSSLFDDLNEFFKDRFGFLYTPIDLLVRFIDLIYGSEAEFTGIPFPELKWNGYVLLEAQTVNFDILEVEEFKNVQNILYFLTNLAMIGALIALIHKKFEEVMQN